MTSFYKQIKIQTLLTNVKRTFKEIQIRLIKIHYYDYYLKKKRGKK